MKVTTAKSRSPRRRREICRSFTCISPWTIFMRWSNGGKSRIDGNLAVERKSEEYSDMGKAGSPNIGVGFGLIFLVRNELNKMVELRRRVESLLQHFESEIENHDDKQLSISSSLPKTLYQWSQCSSPDDACFRRDGVGREKSLRMDQLEAELEAEFDHLQLYDPEFVDLNVEQNAGEVGLLEEVERDELGGGVSARDLERRLQQVLEWRRQQERIEELESSLEQAMQLLEEKERDLSLLHTFPPSPPSYSTSNNQWTRPPL